jgi:2-phospho-L-lactate/phosphoenolpyruvate guanylyltransferase
VPTWTLVIPLKPSGDGKTRLGADAGLARAIALDTVEAASNAFHVGRVVVVTADPTLTTELDAMAGVEVELEPRPAGIASAIARGFARVDPANLRAALLGDLPGLVPADLDAALELANGVDRAFVRDAEGSGTTLVTARSGVGFEERFGPGSAEAHRTAGLEELDVSAQSSVRYDVDDPDQLAELARRGIGPRTRARLESGTP